MSESHPSNVFMFGADDPQMEEAKREARKTFGYFWREIAWERRRIVPALDMAAVKAPFADGPPSPQQTDHPQVEEMWISEVDFDGQAVSGELLNSPNWLKSVTEGDEVRVPGGKISDWMYVIEGQVYGAHTVQVLRSRMGRGERAEHDQAWGLDFGDPSKVRLVPMAKGGSLLKGWFSKREHDAAALEGDHPMSINMAPSLREQIARDPSFMTSKDERGWTVLHHLALAGSVACVKVLLEAGADPRTKTAKGFTAAQLAKVLGWTEVVALLDGTH